MCYYWNLLHSFGQLCHSMVWLFMSTAINNRPLLWMILYFILILIYLEILLIYFFCAVFLFSITVNPKCRAHEIYKKFISQKNFHGVSWWTNGKLTVVATTWVCRDEWRQKRHHQYSQIRLIHLVSPHHS